MTLRQRALLQLNSFFRPRIYIYIYVYTETIGWKPGMTIKAKWTIVVSHEY